MPEQISGRENPMFQSYKVKNIEIKNGLVLAPMSGVTTRPFRRLIKEHNRDAVGLVVTEFISVEALTRKVQKSLAMMHYSEEERPFCVQIFGHDIARMIEAAKMVQDAGADIVDINSGCPAPKVVRKGGGCNLMREPEHLKLLLRGVRKAVDIPLTIKIRSGWDENSKNAIEIARIAEGEGVDALAIHARSRTQLYRGLADWNLVAEVAEKLSIPVLGSGDVTDTESAAARYKFGIAGIYIGRAAMSNPFVFSDILNQTKRDLKKEPGLVLRILRRYIELLLEDFTPFGAVGKVKQLASQMCKGYEWRKSICLASSLEQIESILTEQEDQFACRKDISKEFSCGVYGAAL